jgi:putative oxidoreductase
MKAVFGSDARFLDLSFLILRVGLGFVFVNAGALKLLNPGFAEMMAMPTWLFLLIGSLEILSGVGVLLGLLTRPSAVYQIIILLGAIFVVGGGNIENMQIPVALDLGLLTMPFALLFHGPGRFSIDAKLFNFRRER